MKSHETQSYVNVGGWQILLWGFKESPPKALQEIGACLLMFAVMFGALFLKDILIWIGEVLG